METIQSISGLILFILQLVITYIDRFIVAFIPWLSIGKLQTRMITLKALKSTLYRVGFVGIVYLITLLF